MLLTTTVAPPLSARPSPTAYAPLQLNKRLQPDAFLYLARQPGSFLFIKTVLSTENGCVWWFFTVPAHI